MFDLVYSNSHILIGAPFFCLGGRCSKDAPRLQKEQKFQFYALLGKDSKMPIVKNSPRLYQSSRGGNPSKRDTVDLERKTP